MKKESPEQHFALFQKVSEFLMQPREQKPSKIESLDSIFGIAIPLDNTKQENALWREFENQPLACFISYEKNGKYFVIIKPDDLIYKTLRQKYKRLIVIPSIPTLPDNQAATINKAA